MFNNGEWLGQVKEEVIDPGREIVDAHHHIWPGDTMNYDLEELAGDTNSGHNIVQTVFLECHAAYRDGGPEHLRCVGETEYVAEAAARSVERDGPASIAAIVAHADLTGERFEEVLDAHEIAGRGLFRGIRHSAACDPNPEALAIPGPAMPGLLSLASFRRGVARLGERGLSFETWLFHHQIKEFTELARATPGTTMILDHFGTPLGVGHYAEKRKEIFEIWQEDIAALAECPNVYAKLGGMAMPDNGFGWHLDERPPTSDEFVQAQRRYYDHTIASFGPERCMFESNFPVDRLSLSYRVLWNGFKKIAAAYSDEEQDQLFAGVAREVYRL
jgi:predicted TIM-barrel fold metal-dependent hydrolase